MELCARFFSSKFSQSVASIRAIEIYHYDCYRVASMLIISIMNSDIRGVCDRRFVMARNWEPWFYWSVKSVKTLIIPSVINPRSSTSMFTILDSCGGADNASKRHRWRWKRLKLWKKDPRRKFNKRAIRLKRKRILEDWKNPKKETVIYLGRMIWPIDNTNIDHKFFWIS